MTWITDYGRTRSPNHERTMFSQPHYISFLFPQGYCLRKEKITVQKFNSNTQQLQNTRRFFKMMELKQKLRGCRKDLDRTVDFILVSWHLKTEEDSSAIYWLQMNTNHSSCCHKTQTITSSYKKRKHSLRSSFPTGSLTHIIISCSPIKSVYSGEISRLFWWSALQMYD